MSAVFLSAVPYLAYLNSKFKTKKVHPRDLLQVITQEQDRMMKV